ncbi:MAG TPA: antibiotic biosynthesis monooxygenase [Spirochaetota bacterium]|nr:antibiotic biosynthesis monooxygenase [Spirochaetota bacterium]
MIVTTVRVFVDKRHIDDFIRATVENHQNSIAEPGNLRFDVLQSLENPAEFTLYEAYISDEAAAAHKDTAHYRAWRDMVAPWMTKPREGLAHKVIAPADSSRW